MCVVGGGEVGQNNREGEKEKGHQQGVGMAWWRFVRG